MEKFGWLNTKPTLVEEMDSKWESLGMKGSDWFYLVPLLLLITVLPHRLASLSLRVLISKVVKKNTYLTGFFSGPKEVR